MQVRKWSRPAALAAVVLTAAAVPPAGAAPAKPDLVVKRLSEPPASAPAGAALPLSVRVANRGARRAGRSTVGFWLSADRRRGAGDLRAGSRELRPVRGRRARSAKRTVRLPAVLAAGTFHVIACADARRKVRERREGNNCRASKGRLTIPGAGGAPGGDPAPGDGPPAPGPSPTATPTATPTAPPAGPIPGDPGPEDPSEADFPLAEDPMTVGHDLQGARAATQEVGGAGGTVSATAEDGTTYTLTVPSGALVSPVDITMTPVGALDGTPLDDGLVGAVQLEPHGLELLKPATLTIDPAGDPGPAAGQTGFLSHDAGEDFHLYPLGMGAALTMQLMHFSTPGVAAATDADRAVVLSHPPERLRAQYEQMMSEVVREARAARIVDEDAGLPADEIAGILRGYYRDVVWPVVQQAYTDDTVAARAVSELLSWARNVQLLGLEEHPKVKVMHDAVWDNLKAIMENAVVQGYDRCVNDHDLDFIARLIGLARMGQLLGMAFGDDAFDKATRCGSFEVDFDSRITESHGYTAGDGRTAQTDGTWHVQALDVPIDLSGLGTGAMTWKAFSYRQELTYPCGSDGGALRYVTTGTTTTPDEAITVLLGMDLNPREPGTPPPADRDIQLRMYQFDAVSETYDRTAPSWCGETPPPPDDPVTEKGWKSRYDQFHLDEWLQGFQGWTLGTGDLVASKTYDRTNTSQGLAELTKVELRHTPLG